MITHVKWQYVAKTTNHQHKAKNAFLYKNLLHLEHILLSHLYLTWIWASMLLLVIDTPICFVQVCHCARTAIRSSACLPLSLTGSLDGVQWRLHVGDWQINMKQGLQRPGELLPLSNLRSTTLSPNQNAAPQHMGHPPPVHRSTAHLKLAQMWPICIFPSKTQDARPARSKPSVGHRSQALGPVNSEVRLQELDLIKPMTSAASSNSRHSAVHDIVDTS